MSFKPLCLLLTLFFSNLVKCKPSSFGEKGDCQVIEVASNSLKPCQFPFISQNQTFYGCTKVATGENGKAWCSTKIDPSTNEHIVGQQFYGDCPNDYYDYDDNCPTEEEGKDQFLYNDILTKTSSK